MSDLQTKLEKLFKLKKSTLHEGELQATMQAIARLAAKNDLSEADLEELERASQGELDPLVRVTLSFGHLKRRQLWLIRLCAILSEFFSVAMFFSTSRFTIYGRQSRCHAVESAYYYLVNQVAFELVPRAVSAESSRMTAIYREPVNRLRAKGIYDPTVWRSSYIFGLLDGFQDLLYEAREEVDPEKKAYALVVQTRKEARDFGLADLKLTEMTVRSEGFDFDQHRQGAAYHKGYTDAPQLKLKTPLVDMKSK